MCLKNINQSELHVCPTMSFVEKICLHNQTAVVQLRKYPKLFCLLCFPTTCSKCWCIDTLFLQDASHVDVTIRKNVPMHMSSFGFNKGQVSDVFKINAPPGYKTTCYESESRKFDCQ